MQTKIGMTVHDPRNMLLISGSAEKKFDAFDWTIIPESPGHYKVMNLVAAEVMWEDHRLSFSLPQELLCLGTSLLQRM